MTADKKILTSLKSALSHLERAILVLDNGRVNPLENSIWHVGAELEYSLFLFSITVQDEIGKSKRKLNSKLKKADLSATLVAAQDLLKKSEKFVKDERMLEAYNSASSARQHILKIQKDLAKKKREKVKKGK